MVVIIGIVLLMVNLCLGWSVIYRRNRVREREENLRQRIKRLSDAGMIHSGPPQNSTNEAGNVEASSASKYCVSNDQPVCNHDDSEASEDDEEARESETSAVNEDNKVYVISTHHHLPYAAPVKSALRHPLMNVSYDDNSVSNTSSLTRDLRWSRSMGNNLDSVHSFNHPPQNIHLPAHHVTAANSRSIAALDVLPRNNALQIQPQPLIVNEHQPPPPNRRTMLPPMEPPSLCHSLRRFANGSTTGSSASGSRPPSPIIGT